MANPPNPIFSILIFLVLTVSYFVTKYIFLTNKMSSTMLSVLLYSYLGLVIISQLLTNLHLTKSLCGSSQWYTSLLVTLLPWTIIFGLLTIILTMFPGWLIPFSNTIGYGITKLAGLNDTLVNIFKPDTKTGNKDLSKALTKIYSDKSLLINEIGISNFETMWNSLKNGGLLNSGVGEKEKNELLNFIYMKTTISEFVWFLLVGLLTLTTSYNFIIQTACSTSVQSMRAKHENINENQQLVDEAKEKAPERRVYSRFE
jgi:hypothetical protein